jgi:ubiquinone/menaquinone biosynthesis C-methylase UbiE
VSETERIARAYKELEEHAAGRWDQRNPGNRAILAERRRLTARLFERQGWLPLADRRVLEVGSGHGGELASLRELGAPASNLVGIDLLPDRVATARRAFPDFQFEAGNAEHLPFPDASFAVVMAITVFSSIFDVTMATNVAAEITRVLRPGGGLLWYDFRYNSPSNRNVHSVSGARVRELFPTFKGDLIGLTLLPPLARRLGPLMPLAYPALVRVPPLRSHLLGLLVKPG